MNPNTVKPLRAAVCCVGYSDFLELTLPHAIRSLWDVTVVTTESDTETLRIAAEHGVQVHTTDAWFSSGSTFNKAAALNTWLDSLDSEENGWVICLDADIIVPPDIIPDLDQLDARGLYGVRRRICAEQHEWDAFIAGHKPWRSFTYDPPEIRRGKLWGIHDTTNVAGIYGYFQLWNPGSAVGDRRFTPHPTAADYDVMFALSFGDQHRHHLPGKEVLHLGPTRTNWTGRRSEKWARSRHLLLDSGFGTYEK